MPNIVRLLNDMLLSFIALNVIFDSEGNGNREEDRNGVIQGFHSIDIIIFM